MNWKDRAAGAETRYETFCRHNGLRRICKGCFETFTPHRRNQVRCVAGCDLGPKYDCGHHHKTIEAAQRCGGDDPTTLRYLTLRP